jgi:predicted solute-binding protein
MKSWWPEMSTPPVFAHLVSLRQPPCRGQHLRPGKAGSAVPNPYEKLVA